MTQPPREDPLVIRAYALIGICAAQFSALEFHIQFLLSYLHSKNELCVETVIFTRGNTFATNLKLIAEFLRLRLGEHAVLRDRGLALVAEIEKKRERRNHFVHGYWLVNSAVVREGLVRLSDTKWKYDRDKTEYRGMDSSDVTFVDLERLAGDIGSLIGQVHTLLADLKAHDQKA